MTPDGLKAPQSELRHEKTNNVVSEKKKKKRAVQAQKMARFWIYKVEELYYPCYCKADLRLCFCICEMLVFL